MRWSNGGDALNEEFRNGSGHFRFSGVQPLKARQPPLGGLTRQLQALACELTVGKLEAPY
ncbi:MAG TPA: hypothetical protein VE641_08825 [Chthoniobacterales bacterium]|nr:hypothetical protein [Chthoniobacterales bacterium]